MTTFYARWKYTILLSTMLLILAARLAISHGRAPEIVVDLCGVFLVILTVVTLCEGPRLRRAAMILGTPTALLTIAARLVSDNLSGPAYLPARISASVFLGYTIVVLIRAVLTDRQITWDTIVERVSNLL
jgi:hypothetical protein